MSNDFDPYRDWLKIADRSKPLTAYRLLGLPDYEADLAKIKKSARVRLNFLEKQQKAGVHPKTAEKLIGQITEAAKLLLHPPRKAKYDAKLQGQAATGAAAAGATPPPPPAVQPVTPATPDPNIPRATPAGGGASIPQAQPLGQPAAPPMAAPVAGGDGDLPSFHFDVAPTAHGEPGSGHHHYRRRKSLLVPILVITGVLVVLGGGVAALMYAPAPKPTVAENESAADAEKPAAPSLDDPNQPTPLADPAESPAAADGPATPAGPIEPGGDKAAVPVKRVAPVEIDEPDQVDWAVTVDAAPAGAEPLTFERLSKITPAFGVAASAVDPEHQAVALGDGRNRIHVWDLAAAEGPAATCDLGGDQAAAFTLLDPQRLLVWTRSGSLRTFSVNDSTLGPAWQVPLQGADSRCGLALSPGGQFVAVVREGIRFYNVANGSLAGIVPVPPALEVANVGFLPSGDRFIILAQPKFGPQLYKLVEVDLATGKAEWQFAPSRPGSLLRDPPAGPLGFYQTGGFQFLIAGLERVFNRADASLPLTVSRAPPGGLLLNDGQVWSPAQPNQPLTFPWPKVTDLLQTYTRSRSTKQLGRGVKVQLSVEISGVPEGEVDKLRTLLKQAATERLQADGMSLAGSADTQLIVEYTEQSGGTANSVLVADAEGHLTERAFEEGVPAATGIVSLTFSSKGKTSWVQNGREPLKKDHLVCPAAQADAAPAEAYRAAVANAAIAQVTGIPLPFFSKFNLVNSSSVEMPLVERSLTPATSPTDATPAAASNLRPTPDG